MNSIDQRLEDFVAQFGEVPVTARKLEDYEARDHRNPWIQRLLGEGIVGQFVLVYQLEERWWTFCFDRREHTGVDAQTWTVEAYRSDGLSWQDTFLYKTALEQGWARRGES